MKASGFQTSSTWHLAAIRAADTTAFARPRMEHRWGQRRSCCARVGVSTGGGVSGSARLRNVSISGAFLETALQLSLFEQIAIAVLGDDGCRQGLEFVASVVRIEAGGVGIEWCDPVSGSICGHLGCHLACAATSGEYP